MIVIDKAAKSSFIAGKLAESFYSLEKFLQIGSELELEHIPSQMKFSEKF